MPIAPSTVVTTITQDAILPKVIDIVNSGNVLMTRLFSKARPWPSGETLKFPVKVAASTALGSYAGFDSFGTAQTNQRVMAQTNASQVYATIAVSGIQRALNEGDAKVIDLVTAEATGIAEDFKQDIGTQLYGDGTGNSSKDLLGIIAAVDDTTSVTTYLNISRSTYTQWRATRTAQSGSLSLANLASDFDAAQIGSDAPTLLVTTPAVFSIYEALLTPTVQHQLSFSGYDMVTVDGVVKGGQVAAGNGFRSLYFRGIPVVADEKCTSGNIYTLNERHLFFYSLKPPYGEVKEGFSWTGWKVPTGQDAFVGQLLWYGQFITDSPRHHARRTGVTS